MNLQVCVPYEPCPFKCKTCISNGRKRFKDLYKEDRRRYLNSLDTCKSEYEDFILTGATEPTLNRHWLKDVLYILRNKNTELQTRNYNLKGYNLEHLKTLSYSITDVKSYLRAWNFRKIEGNNRLVILLTKEFNFLTAENFNAMGFNQITFKVLQHTVDVKTNEYIDKIKMKDFDNIYEIIERFNGSSISVRIDTSCQNSHGRYEIFRSDGEYYDSWESETPL